MNEWMEGIPTATRSGIPTGRETKQGMGRQEEITRWTGLWKSSDQRPIFFAVSWMKKRRMMVGVGVVGLIMNLPAVTRGADVWSDGEEETFHWRLLFLEPNFGWEKTAAASKLRLWLWPFIIRLGAPRDKTHWQHNQFADIVLSIMGLWQGN